MRRGSCLVVVAIAGVVLAGTASAGEDDSARGEAVYGAACAPCHGPGGDGKGPVAAYFDPLPRDFTRGAFKFRSTGSGELPLTEDLVRTITRGVPGTAMPAWQDKLPVSDIEAVAGFVKTFSPRFVTARRAPRAVDPPAVASPGTPDLGEGRALFLLYRCWDCHGIGGQGDGPSAPTLKDDGGRPIAATSFARGLFRGGDRAPDLFRTLSTGLNGTPMPSFRDAMPAGREAFEDLGTLPEQVEAATLAQVRAYARALPTQEAVDALDEVGRRALGDARLWLIIAYVRSLARPSEVFEYLFCDAAGRLPQPHGGEP